MNLRQIEVFRAVMLAGSVTAAAEVLHVSQPAISRMLGHIELQLGLRLFQRGRGRLRPTPEAQALQAEVEQMYRGVQRVNEFARELKQGSGVALRVLASPSAALEIVPRAVAQLTSRFAGARAYIETQLVREMVGQLLRHEADVAIATLPIEHALLSSRVVGSWSLACAFRAGHAFEGRTQVGPRELLAEPLIAFSADTPQGQLIADWCRDNGLVPKARIEVRSGQLACALAACGAGMAVVDDLTARAWGRDRLGFRPLSRAPTFDMFAVHHRDFPLSALGLAFVDAVQAVAGTIPRSRAGRRPATTASAAARVGHGARAS